MLQLIHPWCPEFVCIVEWGSLVARKGDQVANMAAERRKFYNIDPAYLAPVKDYRQYISQASNYCVIIVSAICLPAEYYVAMP